MLIAYITILGTCSEVYTNFGRGFVFYEFCKFHEHIQDMSYFYVL